MSASNLDKALQEYRSALAELIDANPRRERRPVKPQLNLGGIPRNDQLSLGSFPCHERVPIHNRTASLPNDAARDPASKEGPALPTGYVNKQQQASFIPTAHKYCDIP